MFKVNDNQYGGLHPSDSLAFYLLFVVAAAYTVNIYVHSIIVTSLGIRLYRDLRFVLRVSRINILTL